MGNLQKKFLFGDEDSEDLVIGDPPTAPAVLAASTPEHIRDSINFQEIWRLLKVNKILIGSIVAFALAGIITYSYLAEISYKTAVLINIEGNSLYNTFADITGN